jgi:hypothetical protein
MNNKKTIILLYAKHELNIETLQESLLSCCKDNDLTIIKTIIADDEYDCQVLTGLINLISSQNGPINLIITNSSLSGLFHVFTYTVIATLLEAELINRLYIYKDERSKTTGTSKPANRKPYATSREKLLEVKKNKLSLSFCAEYYRAMIMFKKIETY